MDGTEGAAEPGSQQKRVMFWFLCSALTGVCSREIFKHTPEQITEETFQIAERMTERWQQTYGAEKDG